MVHRLDAGVGKAGEVGVMKVLCDEPVPGSRKPRLECFESQRSITFRLRNVDVPSDLRDASRREPPKDIPLF